MQKDHSAPKPNVHDIIREAESLPAENRAAVEAEWIAVAERRRQELREGKTATVPGEQALAEARKRLTG